MPTIDDMLVGARARLERVTPSQAVQAMRDGAVLVDMRSDDQREQDGVIPDAIRIARNVLEWRADPYSDHRDPRVSDPDVPVILFCDAGYASSLAAVVLQDLGLPHATDLDGGFQAWRAAGLPVAPSR